jgi:hypothetical protein
MGRRVGEGRVGEGAFGVQRSAFGVQRRAGALAGKFVCGHNQKLKMEIDQKRKCKNKAKR